MSFKWIASLLVLSNTLLCINVYCSYAAGRVLPGGAGGCGGGGTWGPAYSNLVKNINALTSLQANCNVAYAEKACSGPVSACKQVWCRQPVQTYSNASPFVSRNLAWHLLTRLHVTGHQCLKACEVEAGHACHSHVVLQHHLLHGSYALLTWDDPIVCQFTRKPQHAGQLIPARRTGS